MLETFVTFFFPPSLFPSFLRVSLCSPGWPRTCCAPQEFPRSMYKALFSHRALQSSTKVLKNQWPIEKNVTVLYLLLLFIIQAPEP